MDGRNPHYDGACGRCASMHKNNNKIPILISGALPVTLVAVQRLLSWVAPASDL